MKQIRRIQTVLAQLGALNRGSLCAGQAARETWDSVMASPGFRGCFFNFVKDTWGITLPDTVGQYDFPPCSAPL